MPDPYARLAGVYDELVVDPCFSSWADFVTSIWAGDTHEVRRVLDVCCGTGLMTVELRDRGFAVVGLDASAQMLVRARARLGPEVALVEAMLPQIPPGPAHAERFDAMVSTHDGFNYLERCDLALTVGRLAAMLRPGGWLVFDTLTDAALAAAVDNPVVLGEHDDVRYAVTYVVTGRDVRSIMSVEVAERPHEDFVEEHRQHVHTDDEIRALLVAAGLEIVGVFDDYTEFPADTTTMRATWVARRTP